MIVRIAAILCLSSAFGWASAETLRFTISHNGQKVGTVTRETTGSDDAGFVEDSLMTIIEQGKTFTLHELDRYDKNGLVTSKSTDESAPGHAVSITAVLGDDGAKVSSVVDGVKSEKVVSLTSKVSRANSTFLWFRKSQPDVGATVTYQSFSMDEAKWSEKILKFAGKKTITIGAREVLANEIDISEGTEKTQEFYDDQRKLLLVLANGLRIERAP
jgi:hypothetical protein